MDIHNMTEDWVITEVNSICDSLEQDGKDASICTCEQCRQDAACYVLNRTSPYYVVSHRGVARVNLDGFTFQQNRADRTALVYEAIKRVSHNQRPYTSHDREKRALKAGATVFNIPAIMGRVYNGLNFSPVADSTVELFQNGNLVAMKDSNWQNPYKLIPNTTGTFTFWPAPEPAAGSGDNSVFRYTIKISGGGFEDFYHSFTIPVESEVGSFSFSMERTFKLPDFYLFLPGEEKDQRALKD